MAVDSIVNDYFKTMSPLAAKMLEDVEDAKSSYEAIWGTLTEKEKMEIINESIMKPEITLKYATLENFDLSRPLSPKDDYMSFFGHEHGVRLVQDENVIWKDEHSAPFLHQTNSQLNLCVLREQQEKKESQHPVMSELAISHSKVLCELKNALKSHDVLKNVHKHEGPHQRESIISSPAGFISKLIGNKLKHCDEDKECLVSVTPKQVVASSDNFFKTNFKSSSDTNREYRSSMLKSSSDLSEEQRGLLSSISHGSSTTEFHSCEDLDQKTESTETLTTTLPRTGFDFLDNW